MTNKPVYVIAGALMSFSAMTLPRTAWAEDVIVKTIAPDNPTSQPAPTGTAAGNGKAGSSSAQPAKSPVRPARAGHVNTGIRRVDAGLIRARLSPEQIGKIESALDPLADQFRQSAQDLQAEFNQTAKDLTEVMGKRDAESQKKSREIIKHQQEAYRKLGQIGENFRPDMEAIFLPMLSDEQAARYKDYIEESSDTPAGRAKQRARTQLWEFRAAELDEEQQNRVRDIIAKELEEFARTNPDYEQNMNRLSELLAKAREAGNEEEQKSIRDDMIKASKSYFDAVKAAREKAMVALSDEQRGKLEAEADKRFKQNVDHVIVAAVLPTEQLGLDEDQKQKVQGLANAARAALTDLGPDEYGLTRDLAAQLKKDIAEVLSDAQKQKYGKAGISWNYGGDNPPEGKPSVVWRD